MIGNCKDKLDSMRHLSFWSFVSTCSNRLILISDDATLLCILNILPYPPTHHAFIHYIFTVHLVYSKTKPVICCWISTVCTFLALRNWITAYHTTGRPFNVFKMIFALNCLCQQKNKIMSASCNWSEVRSSSRYFFDVQEICANGTCF